MFQTELIRKIISGRLLAVISVVEGVVYLFLWDKAVNLLLPLGDATLAKIVVGLSLSVILVLTWAIPIFIKNASYRKDLLEYNPKHFAEKEFGKWFNYYAKKKEK